MYALFFSLLHMSFIYYEKKLNWGVSHKEMVGHNYSLDYLWQVWDLTNISVLTKTML